MVQSNTAQRELHRDPPAQQQIDDRVEARGVVGADEDEQQIGFLATEAGEDSASGAFHGRAQVAIRIDC